MAAFEDWTYEDAQAAIDEAIQVQVGSADAFTQNHAFVELKDHWQDGDGWVGPDGGSNEEIRARVLAAVERQFTPRDAIGEVLDRMANALLRQEPDVDFVRLDPLPESASEEEQATAAAEVEELKALVSAWWDAKHLWQKVRRAVRRSRWACRGSLRAWIAPGHLDTAVVKSTDDDGEEETGPSVAISLLPQVSDFAEALAMVQIAAPEPDVCYVYTDEETQERVAIFLFEDPETDKPAAELWWVDDDGLSHFRVVGNDTDVDDEVGVDLGGRLPIVEMEGELLITEPIRRQQKRLNFAESLLVRVSETGGFPERYTLNAEPGGLWSLTAPSDGPALKTAHQDGKTWYLHPSPRTLGAAITTDLVGVVTRSGDAETRATPGVVFKDPTDPGFAIKTSRHAYRTILEEAKQGHMIDEGTGEASGIAYQQARADYEDDLNAVRPNVEGLVRDTLGVVLAWADAMTAEPRRYLDRYRISVTMKVRSGPVTPDEQRQHNENVKAGTLSAETAMALNGVEDVDAELQKLRSSPESIVDLRQKQVAGVVELAAEGFSFERAAKIMGISDPELLAEFKAADQEKAASTDQGAAQDAEIAQLLAGTGAGGGTGA